MPDVALVELPPKKSSGLGQYKIVILPSEYTHCSCRVIQHCFQRDIMYAQR